MPPKRGKRVEESEESSEGSADESRDEIVHVDPAEFMGKLAPDVRKRVHGLKSLQLDFDQQYEAYKEEMRQLEKKYEKLYEPLFAKRKDIVQGIVEPTEDEISKGAKVMEIKEEGEEAKVEGETKGIPKFWLTALKNNEMTEEAITAKDEECLSFLKDITCQNFDDPNKGFTLTFHFDENPFFTNTELTKKYYLIDEDDIMLEKAEGCEIDWKANKNLTVVMKKKKQKHKGGKNVRTVTKAEPCESFFNFFAPPKIPDGDCSEEEEDELEDMIEADYELGRTFKDKLIPRAVDWYTGEAIPTLEFEAGDGADEDDEDEDEEEEKPKGKKKKGQITQGGAAKQPECQQQ